MSNKLLILFLVTIFSGPNCIINASQKIKEQSFVKKASKRKENKPTKKVVERAQNRKIFFLNEASNKKETSFAKKVMLVAGTILSVGASWWVYTYYSEEKNTTEKEIEDTLLDIYTKFSELHEKGKMHDQNNINFLQCVYSKIPRYFDFVVHQFVDASNGKLETYLDDTKYEGKTIFYQALERKDLATTKSLLSLSHTVYNLESPLKLSYINHHPKNKDHPIQLLYEIPDAKFKVLDIGFPPENRDRKKRKKELLRLFMGSGLNKEGFDVVKKYDKSLYDEYFTGQNG